MILDTNALSFFLERNEGIEFIESCPRLSLPVIVLGEYQHGLKQSRLCERLERELTVLKSVSNILEINESTVGHYADIREELRQTGNPIPQNDLWIAALARQHGLEIASQDKHFDFVKGLRRHGW